MKGSSITTTLVIFLAVVGIVLWRIIIRTNGNILVSALIAIPLLTLIGSTFHGGAWRGVCLVMHEWIPLTWFFVALVTSHCFSSLISGAWGSLPGIPSVCFGIMGGWLHIHHWAEGLILIGVVMRLMAHFNRYARTQDGTALHRFGLRLVLSMLTLWILAAGMFLSHPHEISLWAVPLWVGAFLGIVLGMTCLSGAYEAITFRICLAVALGIALGIVTSGGIEAIKDFVQREGVPSALIFFSDQPTPGCRVQ